MSEINQGDTTKVDAMSEPRLLIGILLALTGATALGFLRERGKARSPWTVAAAIVACAGLVLVALNAPMGA